MRNAMREWEMRWVLLVVRIALRCRWCHVLRWSRNTTTLVRMHRLLVLVEGWMGGSRERQGGAQAGLGLMEGWARLRRQRLRKLLVLE